MKKIGFIGFGNMAQAIITGLISSGNFMPQEIGVFDTDANKIKLASETLNITFFNSNDDLIENCESIVLAVKPNALQKLLISVSEKLCKANPLVISIAAGQSIEKLQNFIGFKCKIVRVMPNINAIAGQAISGFTVSDNVSEDEIVFAQKVLSSFGKCVEVSENFFSAYSAIGGCSPAYSYLFADALARVGVKYGLTKKESLDIVVETISKTLSKNSFVESDEMNEIVSNAIKSAYNKDKELGK